MGPFFQSLREDWTVVRERPFLAISLLALGILIGYGSSRIAEFEQQFGRISNGRAVRYRDLSNTELRQKVINLIVPFRSFANAAKRDFTDLRFACDGEMGKATTDDGRTQIKKRCDENSFRLTEKHVAIYNEQFKSEAIFLREEILRRLPPGYRTKITPPIFWDFPTNNFGFEMVVTSLELLHKSLPDR
jgi:hypothetical protein